MLSSNGTEEDDGDSRRPLYFRRAPAEDQQHMPTPETEDAGDGAPGWAAGAAIAGTEAALSVSAHPRSEFGQSLPKGHASPPAGAIQTGDASQAVTSYASEDGVFFILLNEE